MNFQSSEVPLSHKYDYTRINEQDLTSTYSISSNLKTESGVPFPINESSKINAAQNLLPTPFGPGDQSATMKAAGLPGNEMYPTYNKSTNYYHEFWRMYLQNEVLISQMKEYVVKTKEIQARISQLEAQCHELELNFLSNMKKEAIKKKRRKAAEIEKSYVCPYDGCNRPYGSDVSLNLHIKIKHSGGNKTEREKLAKMIIEAKLKNESLPEISLNLPPGFLESLNIHKILKLKDRKDKDVVEGGQAKDLWKDLKLTNTDLTNLLTELDKAIEGEKHKGHDQQEIKTPKSQETGLLDNASSQASPSSSMNN